MTENFAPVEYTTEAPFTARRSYHFWAHELMAISVHQPESLRRMRHGCGHGGPNQLRPEFLGVEDAQ